jgi:alpha-beta hydrolase superfamily lysophospholipase
MSETTLSELTLTGSAGHRLSVRIWEGERPDAVVVISHGFGEHAGRYDHAAWRLTESGYRVVVPDHHGHGLSGGPRARVDFATAVADLDALLDNPGINPPGSTVFMLGHSMGGAIALRYAIAHRERLKGLVLSSPLTILDATRATKILGSLLARVLPGAPTVKLDPALVSRDPDVVAAYRADPLVHHGAIPAVTAAAFVAHADTIMEDATEMRVPTLLLYGTADGLCPPKGSQRLARAIGAVDRTTHAYEGLYHEILNEPEQDEILDTIVAWLDAH